MVRVYQDHIRLQQRTHAPGLLTSPSTLAKALGEVSTTSRWSDSMLLSLDTRKREHT